MLSRNRSSVLPLLLLKLLLCMSCLWGVEGTCLPSLPQPGTPNSGYGLGEFSVEGLPEKRSQEEYSI